VATFQAKELEKWRNGERENGKAFIAKNAWYKRIWLFGSFKKKPIEYNCHFTLLAAKM
jgi:hypothetical protein